MKRASNPNAEQVRPDATGEGDKRFLSPRQMAERWDCSATTAQRIAMNAGMAKYCLGEGKNGMVRYLLSEVEAYEQERRVAGVI